MVHNSLDFGRNGNKVGNSCVNTLLDRTGIMRSSRVQLTTISLGPGRFKIEPSINLRMILIEVGNIYASYHDASRSIPVDIIAPSLCIIPPKSSLIMKLTTFAELDVLCISENILQSVASEFAVSAQNLSQMEMGTGIQDDLLMQTMVAIKETHGRRDKTSFVEMDYLTRLIVSRVIARHFLTRVEREIGHNLLSRSAFDKVFSFVETNIHRHISISQLCGMLGVGPAQFSRLFKQATGQTVRQFIIGKRIERAKTMLESTKIRIADIAHDCGFSDQMHLTRAFRTFTGFSPAEYRRRMQ